VTEPVYTGGRLRAYLEFLAAFLYLFFAQHLAFHGAQGLAGDAWSPLVEKAMLVFSSAHRLCGHGFLVRPQVHPISEQVCRGAPAGCARPVWAGDRLGDRPGLRAASYRNRPASPSRSLRRPHRGGGWWPMRPTLRCSLWRKRSLFAVTPSSALLVRSRRTTGAALGFARSYAILQALCREQVAQLGRCPCRSVLPCLSAHPVPTGLAGDTVEVSHGAAFGHGDLVIGLASAASQPFAGGAGRSYGAVLAHGRIVRTRRELGHIFVLLAALPAVFRVTRDLNYRYNTPVIVAGRDSRRSRCHLARAARSRHGPAAPAAPTLVQIGNAGTWEQATKGPRRRPMANSQWPRARLSPCALLVPCSVVS